MIIRTLLALSLMRTLASDETTRCSLQANASTLFEDDFESGLGKWTTYGVGTARVRVSGDTVHGNVLVLIPNGDAYALIKGSERFGAMRIEGDVLFPNETDNYLGVMYNLAGEGNEPISASFTSRATTATCKPILTGTSMCRGRYTRSSEPL